MRTTIHCIILLACMTVCSSAVIKACRCVNTRSRVNHNLVVTIKEYGVRPYCKTPEVIVTMKDGNEWCLDPKAKFTTVLLRVHNRKAAKMNITTTAPETPMVTSS